MMAAMTASAPGPATYLLTGAASGLGKSLALELSKQEAQPARLILTDLQPAALEETARQCREAGALVHAFACDLTQERALPEAMRALPADWQLPDVVVANAGLGGVNPGYAFSREVDRKIMAVNYDGMVHTLVPFIAGMIERRRGTLVGISSLAALRGLPHASSYCASKAAQMTFLESLRVDLRPFGVEVCCVHPGFIRTPMTAHSEFPMPFMVTSAESARLVLRAIRRGSSQAYFPTVLGWVSRLNRLLPNWLSDRLAQVVAGKRDKRARIFSTSNSPSSAVDQNRAG